MTMVVFFETALPMETLFRAYLDAGEAARLASIAADEAREYASSDGARFKAPHVRAAILARERETREAAERAETALRRARDAYYAATGRTVGA